MSDKQHDSTILDIAALLKLSPATISRALNNHPHVKDKTRKAVLEAANKLGYSRNVLASGLRGRKTNTVGMIVPRISMFFHAAVITAVQTALYQHGYNLIISQSNDNPQLEKQLMDTFYASRVDAVLVACSLRTTDFSIFQKFSRRETPVVFYDRIPNDGLGAHIVRGDDVMGGYIAGNHLAERGCVRVAHISGPESSNLYSDRKRGFIKAINEHGLSIDPDHIIHQDLTYENAKVSFKQLMEQPQPPDGIFTANDVTAMAVLEAAKAYGLNVPEQLKIIGYSNDPRTSIVTPALTTIEQFPEEVGLRAAETIVRLTNEAMSASTLKSYQQITTPVRLIKRNST